jgi:hypothetical protein
MPALAECFNGIPRARVFHRRGEAIQQITPESDEFENLSRDIDWK